MVCEFDGFSKSSRLPVVSLCKQDRTNRPNQRVQKSVGLFQSPVEWALTIKSPDFR